MAIAISDSVLVEIPKISQKTKGGIYLTIGSADKETKGLNIGKVLAVGELAFEKLTVKPSVGDLVYITRYAGQHVPSDKGNEKRLIYDNHILGIIEPEDLKDQTLEFENETIEAEISVC